MPMLGGAGGAAAPLFHLRQEGQVLPFILNTSPLFCERPFSGVVDILVQENFSRAKTQTPNLSWQLVCGQYTKHCLSRKELEHQNLPLWRSIQVHRCALR